MERLGEVVGYNTIVDVKIFERAISKGVFVLGERVEGGPALVAVAEALKTAMNEQVMGE